MRPFQISALRENTILDVYSLRQLIDTEPVYQRQSEIWEEYKRQLLVDSLLNGFDLPKIYFHEFGTPKKQFRYAIIDGKQRLESIWAFLEDGFPLSQEFEFFEDPSTEAGGLTYTELSAKYPRLKSRLDKTRLPIVVVQTDDLEMIEEMFSRLNEAVPLNAPEKRNALGGPLPPQIRGLVTHEFFKSRLHFDNNRYRHLDLATKFLYVEYRGGLADTKKRNLDDFVRMFKQEKRGGESKELAAKTRRVLDRMGSVFTPGDYLLSSVGMVVVYYQVFRDVVNRKLPQRIAERTLLVDFDERRQANRALAREAEERGRRGEAQRKGAPPVDPSLLAFDRYMQSPNDAAALRHRYDVLVAFLKSAAA